ncbi:hypothetical protein [Endozoicomonas sp. ONNA2]|uniref:hypothetical protein n=1 Tax=Endozoicomonas sp. ONNA2 TaxID=2828741 RepID=UPI0021472ABB|nr:hypothetical protein [Endozoicomonas sp. ONNA2]
MKQCTTDYCGSGHLDIGKALAFAAGQSLEESSVQLNNEFQWKKDIVMILLNISLILLIPTIVSGIDPE